MGSSEELVFAYDGMRHAGLKAVSPRWSRCSCPTGPGGVGLERGAKPVCPPRSRRDARPDRRRSPTPGATSSTARRTSRCAVVSRPASRAVPIAGFAQMRIVLSKPTTTRPAPSVRPGPQRLRLRRGRRPAGHRDRGARQARGANVLAHHGRLGDLRRLPHGGAGPRRRAAPVTAIARAVQLAGLAPTDDHINAHATGTSVGDDVAEAKGHQQRDGRAPPAVAPKKAAWAIPWAPSAQWSPFSPCRRCATGRSAHAEPGESRSRDRPGRGFGPAHRGLPVRGEQLVRIRRAQRRHRVRQVLRYAKSDGKQVRMTTMAPTR